MRKTYSFLWMITTIMTFPTLCGSELPNTDHLGSKTEGRMTTLPQSTFKPTDTGFLPADLVEMITGFFDNDKDRYRLTWRDGFLNVNSLVSLAKTSRGLHKTLSFTLNVFQRLDLAKIPNLRHTFRSMNPDFVGLLYGLNTTNPKEFDLLVQHIINSSNITIDLNATIAAINQNTNLTKPAKSILKILCKSLKSSSSWDIRIVPSKLRDLAQEYQNNKSIILEIAAKLCLKAAYTATASPQVILWFADQIRQIANMFPFECPERETYARMSGELYLRAGENDKATIANMRDAAQGIIAITKLSTKTEHLHDNAATLLQFSAAHKLAKSWDKEFAAVILMSLAKLYSADRPEYKKYTTMTNNIR